MTTEVKTKKTRTPKKQAAADLMNSIKHQALSVKVDLYGLLKSSIDEDAKALKEQLSLIEKVK